MGTSSGSVRERIVRGAKASLVGKAIYIGSNALLIVLFTRVLLTPDGFGRLYYALSVLGVVSLFATLGLPKSTARYVNEYLETDPSQVRYIIRTSVGVLLALVAVVSLTLFVAGGWVARWLGQPGVTPFIRVGAAFVAASTLSSYWINLFQAFNRVTMSATVSAVSAVGRVVFAVGFVLAGLGAVGALMGYAAGYALSAAVGGGVLYWRYYARLEPSDSPEPGLARRMLRYSVPLTATKGAGVLDKRVDAILVGSILNPVAVGYYVVAKQVSEVLSSPAASFGFALSPTLGEQRAVDRDDRARRLYQESLQYVLLFYVPAATGLVLVADPLVRFVFGPDYAPAVPVLQVFGAYVVVQAVNMITTDGLDYLGRARARSVAKVTMGVSNVALNLLLIPRLGVTGAAVATVITYSFYTLANVYVLHSELSLRVGRVGRDLGVILAISLGMAAPVVVTRPYVSGIVSLLGTVLLGGLVWMGLSVLAGLLDLQEVRSFLL